MIGEFLTKSEVRYQMLDPRIDALNQAQNWMSYIDLHMPIERLPSCTVFREGGLRRLVGVTAKGYANCNQWTDWFPSTKTLHLESTRSPHASRWQFGNVIIINVLLLDIVPFPYSCSTYYFAAYLLLFLVFFPSGRWCCEVAIKTRACWCRVNGSKM